ncbi:MAG: OmpA family protein [Planctomycetota bacterium]
MNKSALTLVLALAGVTALSGCVPQSEYDQLLQIIRTQEETNFGLRARIQALQDELAALRGGASAEEAKELAFKQRIAELEQQITALQAALAKAEADLIDAISGTGLEGIDVQLASKLEALARANPELMEWDETRNMIRLRSDLTFGSGSIELRPAAADALAKLADVLKDPTAEPYEVRIVGHTDNVRVRARPGRRFNNNWELSAFRAIAVKDAFTRKGISNGRLSIAGYGEHQPVVPNGPRGAEANRRVEIFLVPLVKPTVSEEAAEQAPAAPAAAGAVEAGDAPTAPEPVEFTK